MNKPDLRPRLVSWVRALAFSAVLLSGATIAGCDGEAGTAAGFWRLQSARLDAATELWNEHEPTQYAFDYRAGCFCPPDVTAPVRITVENGEVVRIVYLEDVRIGDGETIPAGDPATEFARGVFGAVDDLLAGIGRTIQQEPVEFEVGYSAEFGYPVHRRSMQCHCPDAGFVEEITGFEALSP